ncbi:hypothetical protein Tco_1017956 [Tanacetum coccineum]|uniref:Uncharacterized protein n=1 Tax=Tanacetum coccineum TaxID=301880 RepID=A0ABQ5FSZ4_9ASTR
MDDVMVHDAVSGWTVLIRKTSPIKSTQLCSTAFNGAEAGVWFFLIEKSMPEPCLWFRNTDETAGGISRLDDYNKKFVELVLVRRSTGLRTSAHAQNENIEQGVATMKGYRGGSGG